MRRTYALAILSELGALALGQLARLPWSRRSQHDAWLAGYQAGARDGLDVRRRARRAAGEDEAAA